MQREYHHQTSSWARANVLRGGLLIVHYLQVEQIDCRRPVRLRELMMSSQRTQIKGCWASDVTLARYLGQVSQSTASTETYAPCIYYSRHINDNTYAGERDLISFTSISGSKKTNNIKE